MNIIKRNGSEAIFDGGKIKACLKKANASVPAENHITDGMIDGIVSGVTGQFRPSQRLFAARWAMFRTIIY